MDACQMDIDGNDYHMAYRFAGEGVLLRTFGYKSFATACMASSEWKQRLVDQGRLMAGFDPDSIFFDQIGGFPDYLCFNTNHAHGNRVDRDWQYRKDVYAALRELLSGDMTVGTEWVNDVAGTMADYIHNLDSVKPGPESFPQLFRHTFPEIVTTNRMVQEEYPGFERDLTYAFMMGVRNCVSIYRCRGHLGMMPAYTRILKKLTDLVHRYEDYMRWGTFVCRSGDGLPAGWERTEYIHRDGTRLLRILWNDSDETRPLPGGREGTAAPGELHFEEVTF